MPAAKPARRTMVITTTPSSIFGLDELNTALRDGWYVLHLGILGHSGPGEDEEWPEGHFSALVVLEDRDRSRHRSESGGVAALDPDLFGRASNTRDDPLPNMSWPENAV